MAEASGVPVADEKKTLEMLRAQVERETAQKHQEDINRAVDEALAQWHGRHQERGDEILSGRVALNDKFAAYAARGLLSESWMPIVVDGSKLQEGKVTEKAILDSLDEFVSGYPLHTQEGRSLSFNAANAQERLFKAMKSADQKFSIDPHVGSIVKMLTNYILGREVLMGCAHHSKVDHVLRDFWKRNKMPKRLKEAVKRKIITGEHFFFYFIDTNGDVTLRDSVKPWDIVNIEANDDDMETILSYERSIASPDDVLKGRAKSLYYADINYYEQLDKAFGQRSDFHGRLSKNKLVQMVKYAGMDNLRGITPLYSVLRYVKYYEDFLVDRIILNHERSKVVWVKVIKGTGSSEGSTTSQGPKSGQVLIETPWLEYKTVNANINAADAKEDGRIIRLAIATGVDMPEHVLFQDASQAVYSSIRNHETPFSQAIRSHQDDWRWDLQEMARVLIREKVIRGLLPKTTRQEIVTLESWNKMYYELRDMIEAGEHAARIKNALKTLMGDSKTTARMIPTEDVDVDVKFPDPVQEDPLKQAQRAEVLYRINVASLPEIASWVGLNWYEQNDLQQKAGGWPEYKPSADHPAPKQPDGKPGELTTTDPQE